MLKKVIFIFMIICLLSLGFANQIVYASEVDSIISDADNFINQR